MGVSQLNTKPQLLYFTSADLRTSSPLRAHKEPCNLLLRNAALQSWHALFRCNTTPSSTFSCRFVPLQSSLYLQPPLVQPSYSLSFSFRRSRLSPPGLFVACGVCYCYSPSSAASAAPRRLHERHKPSSSSPARTRTREEPCNPTTTPL